MAIKGSNGFLIPRGKSKFTASLVLVGDCVLIETGINSGKIMRVVNVLGNNAIAVDDKEFGEPVYYAVSEYSVI